MDQVVSKQLVNAGNEVGRIADFDSPFRFYQPSAAPGTLSRALLVAVMFTIPFLHGVEVSSSSDLSSLKTQEAIGLFRNQ